jgi:hypothetical protein
MRIIITGGTGFIGTELAASLIQDGHEVIALSRDPDRQRTVMHANVHLVKWDARTAAGWGDLADGADAIVNLAGENIGAGRWTRQRKQAIIQSRFDAGKAVVEAVANASSKPGVVIQSSGVDYYGIHAEEIITEEHPPGDNFLSETCRIWEEATFPIEKLGVRRVVYRGAVVLSLEGGALSRILLPYRFFAGGPLGSGNQWFSWIHIQDQIAAMRFLIENSHSSGVYNLCSPYPLQNKDLARTIGRVMGRPSIFPVPAFAIRLIFGEMAMTVLGGQRVIPQKLLKDGFNFTFPEVEQALHELVGR